MHRHPYNFWQRSLAILAILSFLNITFFPTTSWALTNLKFQEEFDAYESGATDMVNLLTGDLAYSMDLLHVPSPEGGFNVNLNYHAGINLEQEASWVGLGWSLNVGSINRSVSGYPDDYKGEIQSHEMKDYGYYGKYDNFIFYQRGYDSRSGKSWGMLNLGIVQFGFGSMAGISALGITINTEGVKADPIGLVNSIVFALSLVVPGGPAIWTALAIDAAMSMATTAIVATAMSISASQQTTNLNHWKISYPNPKLIGHQNYSGSLDAVDDESMYGLLYLGDIPTDDFSYEGPFIRDKNGGNTATWNSSSPQLGRVPLFCDKTTNVPATIMAGIIAAAGTSHPSYGNPQQHYSTGANHNNNTVGDGYIPRNESDYGSNHEPSHLTYDNYRVNGPGISGNIKPYRLDQGSIAESILNGTKIHRYNAVPFLSTTEYKPNFVYEGEAANYYAHHITLNGNKIPQLETTYENNPKIYTSKSFDYFRFQFNDEKSTDGTKNIETANRQGLYNKKFGGAKYVDFETINSGNQPDLINSFVITGSDGKNYHFGLPVFQYGKYSYSGNKPNPIFPNLDKYHKTTDENKLAVHWLLTGITGSDYRDDGNNILDDEDEGYWVKFNYAQFTDNYAVRSNYISDELTTPIVSGSDKYNSYESTRDEFYLESIETRTHIALLVKDIRFDGRGFYKTNQSPSSNNTKPTSKLSLSEIILLAKDDYHDMISTYGSSGTIAGNGGIYSATGYEQLVNGESIEDIMDVIDISGTSGLRTFIDDHQLRRIQFNYMSYDSGTDDCLCDKTYNSFDASGTLPDNHLTGTFPNQTYSTTGRKCKLTLEGISTYGENDYKLIPDYSFEYSTNNPDYDPSKFDKWGMYWENGEDFSKGHNFKRSTDQTKEDNWCLKKIISPTGSTVEIEYERDSYSSYSGKPLFWRLDVSSYDGASSNFVAYTSGNETIDRSWILNKQVFAILDVICDPTCSVPTTPTVTSYNTSTNKFTLSGTSGTISDATGYLIVPIEELDGGNLRVKTLTSTDELGNQLVTKYEYNKFGEAISSGVVAKEPIMSRSLEYPFYFYYDYPETPVFYKNITVKQNYDDQNESYDSKKEFEFVTPHYSMVSQEEDYTAPNPSWITLLGSPSLLLPPVPSLRDGDVDVLGRLYNERVEVKTSGIGKVKSIKEYNNRDQLVQSVDFHFTTPDLIDTEFSSKTNGDPYFEKYPGMRTEGTWVTQGVLSDVYTGGSGTGVKDWYLQFRRTNKIYYPTLMEKAVYTQNGYSYEIKNTGYDYTTGQLTEQEFSNSLGYKYKSVKTPAYHVYDEMGSKVIDNNYANILAPAYKEELYVILNGNEKRIGTSINTWKKQWENALVWRKHASYAWEGELEYNGVYKNYTDFVIGGNNSEWIATSEYTRFSDNSFPKETKIVGDQFACTQKDVFDNMIQATVANAQLAEISYSGGENNVLISSTTYYDGGVTLANSSACVTSAVSGTVTPHTGSYLYEIPANGTLKIETDGSLYQAIPEGGKYMISLWQHETGFGQANPPVVKVTFKNGTWGTTTIDDETVNIITVDANKDVTLADKNLEEETCNDMRYGDWHLLELTDIVNTTTTDPTFQIEIIIDNEGSNPIYLDDIRFLPLNATMVSQILDQGTSRVLAKHNSKNLGLMYEYYDNADYKIEKLKQINKEYPYENVSEPGGFIKVMEKDYNILE